MVQGDVSRFFFLNLLLSNGCISNELFLMFFFFFLFYLNRNIL